MKLIRIVTIVLFVLIFLGIFEEIHAHPSNATVSAISSDHRVSYKSVKIKEKTQHTFTIHYSELPVRNKIAVHRAMVKVLKLYIITHDTNCLLDQIELNVSKALEESKYDHTAEYMCISENH